ncbi:unnamed protein product [Sphagnum balticum]
MAMMDICSDPEDRQTSTMHEASLLALRVRKAGRKDRLGLGNPNLGSSGGDGGDKAPSIGSKEFFLATEGTSVLSAHGTNEGQKEKDILASERLLTKGKLAAPAPDDPTPTSALQRPQARGNDGDASGECPQRPALTSYHREGASAERWGATEGLPSKELGLSKGLTARGNQNATSTTPPITSRTTHLTKGPGPTAPTGTDHQGPSPVDPSLEVEAEFPTEMVLEMQNAAAKKARRTVIRRTLGGRTSFKALHECVKLHLPTSFVSITLLTRGYFLILFDNEEGAIAIRKLTMVDWSGLTLSFSRFSPDFDASAQGAKALLTHTIKVQFPDLHEQFRNAKALTIMASKLGEVLDIEAEDSYIKRPAGPMVTLEVLDISKLAGFIRIPSMSEGAGTANSIRQRILYSGLLNQCRKCRKFGHHAKACNVSLAKPQVGPAHRNSP